MHRPNAGRWPAGERGECPPGRLRLETGPAAEEAGRVADPADARAALRVLPGEPVGASQPQPVPGADQQVVGAAQLAGLAAQAALELGRAAAGLRAPAELGDDDAGVIVVLDDHPPRLLDQPHHPAGAGRIGMDSGIVEGPPDPWDRVEALQVAGRRHGTRQVPAGAPVEAAEEDPGAGVDAADRLRGDREQPGVVARRDREGEVVEVPLVPDLPAADRPQRQGIGGEGRVLDPEVASRAVAADRGPDESPPGASLGRGSSRQGPIGFGEPTRGPVEEGQHLEVMASATSTWRSMWLHR